MQTVLNVLHLEDDRLDAELIRDTLCAQGLLAEIIHVQTEDEFRSTIQNKDIELVLADYSLPGFDGLTALDITREICPDLPFIFVSGTMGDEVAVDTLKRGATDYVLKDRLQRLGSSVRRALSDVEERRARRVAAQALRDSEVRYRRLFESAKDGILILDAGSGQIADVNPFLSELLDYSREEMVGKTLWEIGALNDVIASKSAFSKLQKEGFVRYDDLPLQSRSGSVIHVEFVSNSYLEGEERVIQCNIRDVTSRRQIEEKLNETNQSLEQALAQLQTKAGELTLMTQQLWQASKLATMGELVASIAHELNNPLTTVALRAESLLEQTAGDEPKQQSLGVIMQEVDRMANLVRGLLQFSRRGHREISTVNVREELTTSVEFLQYYLRSRNIRVVTSFADPLPAVLADRQQLRQLFLNLLTNAVDAMPEPGVLTLSAGPAEQGGVAVVVIQFVDTGAGIAHEDLERVWEPFFTTKPDGRGTGLGLAICRRIVEDHSGSIAITSTLGAGTTVRITLPNSETDQLPLRGFELESNKEYDADTSASETPLGQARGDR
jgi:PAS domain S-box-containing protein